MTNGRRTIQFHLRTLLALTSFGVAEVSNLPGAAAAAPVPIVGPPYQGSNNGGAACATTRRTSGWQPTTPGPWPVFLYFIGTSNPTAFDTDPAGADIVKEMAKRGYYALRVQYDSAALPNPLATGWTNAAYFHNKAACIFDPTRPGSLTNAVCSSPQLNCSRGIAVWGHSQGALMAAMSGNYDGRIRAAVAMGLGPGYGTRAWTREFQLAPNRLRLINGRQDEGLILDDKARVGRETTGWLDSLQPGSTAAGWYIVENNEVADGWADLPAVPSGAYSTLAVSRTSVRTVWASSDKGNQLSISGLTVSR